MHLTFKSIQFVSEKRDMYNFIICRSVVNSETQADRT